MGVSDNETLRFASLTRLLLTDCVGSCFAQVSASAQQPVPDDLANLLPVIEPNVGQADPTARIPDPWSRVHSPASPRTIGVVIHGMIDVNVQPVIRAGGAIQQENVVRVVLVGGNGKSGGSAARGSL